MGIRRGIQRYKCNDCGKKFSSIRRPQNLQEIIFKKYVYNRQILKNLATEYQRSIPWVRQQILAYETPEKVHKPRVVVLVCDATFYGKRSDKLGTLVFKVDYFTVCFHLFHNYVSIFSNKFQECKIIT